MIRDIIRCILRACCCAANTDSQLMLDGGIVLEDGRNIQEDGRNIQGTAREQLLQLDSRLCNVALKKLQDSQPYIRLVRISFLLNQSPYWQLPRMQDLRSYKDALLTPDEAIALLKRGDRSIFVLSYGWLSKTHPDSGGHRFHKVVEFFQYLHKCKLLPKDAALFWDFGSLPQHPRSKEEEHEFKEGLKYMADLYASPLGTCILQLHEIPPRPSDLEGGVLVCGLPRETNEATVTKAFSSYGDIVEYNVLERTGDVRLRFASHESAARAAAEYPANECGLLGPDVFTCLEYNDLETMQRGWCVFEEAVSLEAVGRSCRHLPMKQILDGMRRPKVYEISTAPPTTPILKLPQEQEIVCNRLLASKFTSAKADRGRVIQMYKEYQMEMASAALAVEIQSGQLSRTRRGLEIEALMPVLRRRGTFGSEGAAVRFAAHAMIEQEKQGDR